MSELNIDRVTIETVEICPNCRAGSGQSPSCYCMWCLGRGERREKISLRELKKILGEQNGNQDSNK